MSQTNKRSNTNSRQSREPSKKKKTNTRLTATSRLILPKPALTEQQQQQALPNLPQQQQQVPLQQHVPPQQYALSQQQHAFSQQHAQYDPKLYSLPLISPQLEIEQVEQVEQVRRDESEEEDCDQNQDPFDEKFGNKWKHDEIKVLLDCIQENYSTWSKGNKTKFYNDMAKNVLPNKEVNAIKSKLARLTKKYESIKKHNNQTGNERKDWHWYDKMDMIFGMRENITPSFLANKETGNIEEEIESSKKENCKKQKSKNSVEAMATAIAEMSQARERIWEQKMVLEKERLEVEKERWTYERERSRMEFELRMKELELKLQRND